MSTPKNYAELRADIVALTDNENNLRRQLIDIQHKKNEAITELVQCAEKLFLSAVNEVPDDTKTTSITYKTQNPSPVEIAQSVTKHKRACSDCHEPGHRAGNPICKVAQENAATKTIEKKEQKLGKKVRRKK